ncbi:MAG: DUF4153 domain-containing protein, partial [Firmicutes bacterium]|nr:DUF4153 domain-containing protein [Bacillota bacterium]
AILFTINTLFAADIPNEVYLDLWLIVAGIFAPACFLAGFPAYGEDNKNDEYPKFLQGLLLYIVMPLLSVYTAILYIYFLKIIITRFWPAGIVSHLVLWYSLVSTVVIFFSYLLKEKNTRARLFIAYFPKLILPLMIMMFAAMGIRISAYGITENRYFVLIGGLWTTGCMLYYALKRDAMNIKIVLSLALVAVFAVSGPWSAYSVSKYSQNMQMKKLLLRNNMLVDGEIVPSAEIPQSDKVSISSIVQYFERNHNLNELHVLPQDFSMSDMEETFGFDFALSSTQTAYFRHHPEETFGLLDVGDYDYFIPSFAEFQEEGTLINKDSLSIAYEAETLKISKDGQLLYTKDIAEAALDIHNANIGKDSLKNEEMIFVDETEHLKIMVIFQSIYGTENGEPSIDWLDFAVLLKIY